MSKKQEDFRKRLLAKIHIHERYKEIKQAGFWEEWVELRYGLKSAKFLSINELKEVLDLFNNKIADRDYMTMDSVGRTQISANKKGFCTKAQRLKIIALATKLQYDERVLCEFIYKQVKKHIQGFIYLENLERKEATDVIVGLEKVYKWRRQTRGHYVNNVGYNNRN